MIASPSARMDPLVAYYRDQHIHAAIRRVRDAATDAVAAVPRGNVRQVTTGESRGGVSPYEVIVTLDAPDADEAFIAAERAFYAHLVRRVTREDAALVQVVLEFA